MAGLGENLL